MTNGSWLIDRRNLLMKAGALGAAARLGLSPSLSQAAVPKVITRPIPSSGEQIPIIGMGTWITFNVGDDTTLRNERAKVFKTFIEMGGGMVDSSPMYGSSEDVVGYCLKRVKERGNFFSATKVWTYTGWLGRQQMNGSFNLWGLDKFDVIHVHNMTDWRTHLETLQDWKAKGKVRYIGITTSHGRMHDGMEKVIKEQPFDFVQFTYNMRDREAEQRLLPAAAQYGKAVVLNRPFAGGALFDMFAGKKLPEWAKEIDCENWAQFFLKYVVSHEAVTCAIPATSQVPHMVQNMGAAYGRLPDKKMRARMLEYVKSL